MRDEFGRSGFIWSARFFSLTKYSSGFSMPLMINATLVTFLMMVLRVLDAEVFSFL